MLPSNLLSMTAVGETLELMHSAYGRSRSIRAVVRVWTDFFEALEPLG